jgi:soluble lytic murein transglycosylase-like protein
MAAILGSVAPSAGIAGAPPSGGGSNGSADVLFVRAIHLEHGEGVTQDPARALGLYCQAGSLGEPRAYLNLGWMYLNGRGIPRNDALAAAWLRRAAQAGVVEAANLLRMIGNPAPAKLPTGCTFFAHFYRWAGAPVDPPVAPAEIRALVQSIAPTYGLDTSFVTAVIATESAFNSNAVSPKRAMGLMQLMPETAARFGVQHPFDAAENIRGGTSYLRWLLDRYAGNTQLALAAYNAGEGAVEAYGGIPPFPETKQYVARVESLYDGIMAGRSGLRVAPRQSLR